MLHYRLFFYLLGILILTPSMASANAGLPVLLLAWPIFWLALIPIILIEFFIAKKTLLRREKLLRAVSISNVISTAFGIPITWVLMFCVQLITPGGGGMYPDLSLFWRTILGATVQAPWMLPDTVFRYWMVGVAFNVMLVPFFFASYWIEAFVNYQLLKKHGFKKADVRRATWRANLGSYALLFCLSLVYLIGTQLIDLP